MGCRRSLTSRATVIALAAIATSPAGIASGEAPRARVDALYKLSAYPLASFLWFPATPHTGELVYLASTSTDATSPITGFAWDLTDLGAFQTGPSIISTTFTTPAKHLVRLRVTNGERLSSVATATIQMSTPPPGFIVPFPVVRIVGTVFANGVKIRRLAVEAPGEARITVTCRRRGCPVRAASRRAPPAAGATWVRFRRFERFLRPGLTLEVRVSRRTDIGAYTRFVVRRRRLPLRVDSCLDPAGINPIVCPSS
ncbi:MAG: hypothetical protein JWN81_2565 [Solirubrobacterales bacterium]|nr:hypothetical protein [Solirubrobacterales bacterium]